MTNALPAHPAQMEEALLDPKRIKELMGPDGHIDPAKFQSFVKDYVKAAYEKDAGLKTQVSEAVSTGLKDFYERAGVKPLPVGSGGLPTVEGAMDEVYRTLGLDRQQRRQIAATGRGPAAALAGQWKTFGDYLAAISPQSIRANGVPKVLNDLSEAIGGDGGFLVPEEFRAELLRLSLETAVVRPRARVIPMALSSVRIPAIIDTSHATTVFGGVNILWAAEAAALSTVTQPSFGQVLLAAKKLTGYTIASNELLADSAISLEALILALFAEALAYFEDDAFIAGTGAGQPLGVLNAAALVSVAKETAQAATTLIYANLVKMFSRALPQSMGRGVWYCHPDVFPQLAQLSLDVGTGGSAVWVTNIAGGPPATIFGRPVVFTEKSETLGTAGDITFADFGYYLIGDRQAISMAASPHANFTTDEMTWRFVQRVDGRPWLLSALTPRNGTNTMSAFVNLATRS